MSMDVLAMVAFLQRISHVIQYLLDQQSLNLLAGRLNERVKLRALEVSDRN